MSARPRLPVLSEDEGCYVSFLVSLWFHTRALVGLPTRREAEDSLIPEVGSWYPVLEWLIDRGQVIA